MENEGKKKVSIFVFIIIFAVLLLVGFVLFYFVNYYGKSENTVDNSTGTSVSDNTSSDNNNSSAVKFWVKTKKWTSGSNSVGIYRSDVVTPVKLESYGVSAINEFINSSDVISSGNNKFKSFSKYRGEVVGGSIHIFNIGSVDMSVSDCYKKGWWTIFDGEESMIHVDSNVDVVDGIADALGKPSYLLVASNDIMNAYDNFQNHTGDTIYNLVYRKGSYVITINVSEHMGSKKSTYLFGEMTYYASEELYNNFENKDSSKFIKVEI